MPGVTTRNRLVKRASRGLNDLLAVCQAMSIAITIVLPVPVAILSADAGQAGVVLGVERLEAGAEVGLAVPPRHLGQVDRRLGRLALAEQHPVLASGVGPVEQQLAGHRGDAVVVAGPPQLDPPRMSLIRELTSRRSPVTSKSMPCCSASPLPVAALPFRPAGTAMNDSLGRRPAFTSPVGPDGPRTKWASGGS